MRQEARRILAMIVLLACLGGLIFAMPSRVLLGWGIACLVTLALCCLLERKLSRLEQRPFHSLTGQLALELLPFLWPLYLAHCLLTFYALWSRPRWEAKWE